MLVPNNKDMRSYGRNPYVGYDSVQPGRFSTMVIFPMTSIRWPASLSSRPMERRARLRCKFCCAERVRSKSVTYPAESGRRDRTPHWTPQQIADGRDVGNVTAQRKTAEWRRGCRLRRDIRVCVPRLPPETADHQELKACRIVRLPRLAVTAFLRYDTPMKSRSSSPGRVFEPEFCRARCDHAVERYRSRALRNSARMTAPMTTSFCGCRKSWGRFTICVNCAARAKGRSGVSR